MIVTQREYDALHQLIRAYVHTKPNGDALKQLLSRLSVRQSGWYFTKVLPDNKGAFWVPDYWNEESWRGNTIHYTETQYLVGPRLEEPK